MNELKKMELFEWSKHYIKFKDCFKKNIQNIEYKKNEIFVKEKQRDIVYHIASDLTTGITNIRNKQEIIITLNTKENFNTLISQWNTLKKYKQLTIVFSHPNNNQTWIVHPYTHNNIAEKNKIKEGLLTLFNNISRV